MVYSGQKYDYYWLQWHGPFLDDLLDFCPALVLNKFIAITACDSGPLNPSVEEESEGWEQVKDIAYFGPILDPDLIPRDQYDEWYIFNINRRIAGPEIFINYGGFSLRDPHYLLDNLDPTWDKVAAQSLVEQILTQQERFWTQLQVLSPETYLADGDNLICVIGDEKLYLQLQAWKP